MDFRMRRLILQSPSIIQMYTSANSQICPPWLPVVLLKRGQLKQLASLQKTALKVLIFVPILSTYLPTDPVTAMSTAWHFWERFGMKTLADLLSLLYRVCFPLVAAVLLPRLQNHIPCLVNIFNCRLFHTEFSSKWSLAEAFFYEIQNVFLCSMFNTLN
jgi:hypothetical protein